MSAAANLGVAADVRIEIVLLRKLGEVAAVFLERFVSGFRIRAGHALVAAHFCERLEKVIATDSERLENLSDGRTGRLIEHREHEMLDADVFILEPLGFVLRLDEQLVQPLRDVEALAGGRVAADARKTI